MPPITGTSLDGLPQFLQATAEQTLAIVPPAGRTRIGVAKMGTRVIPNDNPNEGGSCGTNGLCGVLDFTSSPG